MEQPVTQSENRQNRVPATNPLLPLILLGVAALFMFVMLFVRTYSFMDFIYKFWRLAPYAALIVGLILFTRNRKNLIFAIGFFALAFFDLVDSFSSLFGGSFGYALFTFLFLSCTCAANAGIGLSYFFGKEKMYTLKTLCACVCVGVAFLMMIITSCVIRGTFVLNLLRFLFCTLPLYAAAILYTPYQK